MNDVTLALAGFTLVAVFTAVLILLPVYAIQGRIDCKKAQSVPMEEKELFLLSRNGLRRFRFGSYKPGETKVNKSSTKGKSGQALSVLFVTLAIGLVISFFLGSGIKSKVADDFVKEYEITKRNGTVMDRCAQAGLVKAAFLQDQNEEKYQEWSSIQKYDCMAAGVPTSP